MRPTLFLLLAALPLRGDPAEPHVLARLGDARFRLHEPATALAYSPDGKLFATSDGAAVAVWAADGRRLRTVPLDKRSLVQALRFSGDGKRLFAAIRVDDRTHLVGIDPAAGKVVSDRNLVVGWWAPAFAPDAGRVVLYALWNAERITKGEPGLRCYDSGTGKELWNDPKVVECRTVVFRPDGGAVLASDAAGSVREYAAATGVRGPEFQVRDLYTTGMAYSPDGKRVYGSGFLPWEEYVYCWDLGTGKPRWVVPAKDVVVVGVLDGGRAVAAREADPADAKAVRWRLRDPETGKPLGSPVAAGTQPQTGFAFHPDGKAIAVATADRLWSSWDVTAGRRLTPPPEPAAQVTHMQLTRDGTRVRGWAGAWYEWDVKTGAQTRLPDRVGEARGRILAASPDGRWLARQIVDKNAIRMIALEVVELATGKVQSVCRMYLNDSADFVGDDRLLVRSNDSVTVYDLKTARVAVAVEFPFATRLSAVAPDGSAVVALDNRGEAVRGVRWDLQTGKKTADWTATAPDQLSVDYDLRAARLDLAAGGEMLMVKSLVSERSALIDAGTGRVLAQWEMNVDAHGYAFRPDNRSLLEFRTEPFAFTLREVATGGVRGRVAFPRSVTNWTFTPDGRAFLVATRVYPVEIWSAVDPGGNWRPKPEAELWAALADPDAAKAYAAIRHLWPHPAEAAGFLKARVKLPEAPSAEWVAERLRGLDAKAFRDRERATDDFLRAGDVVLPALRAARPTASAEARERIDKVLTAFPKSPARLQAIRVCEVAEGLGTPAALELLKGWAADPLTTLGREARSSVERIGRR